MAEPESQAVQAFVDQAVEEARLVASDAVAVFGMEKMIAAGEAAERAARKAASEALREVEAAGLSDYEKAKKAVVAAREAGERVTAEAREAAQRESTAIWSAVCQAIEEAGPNAFTKWEEISVGKDAKAAGRKAVLEARAAGKMEQQATEEAVEVVFKTVKRIAAEMRKARVTAREEREAREARDTVYPREFARVGEKTPLVDVAGKLAASITEMSASIAQLAVEVEHLAVSRRP